MRIKIFKSFAEEEDAKWEQMAKRSVDEHMQIMFQLQRMAFPDTFNPITGKRKPLEHRITKKKNPLLYGSENLSEDKKD